MTEPVAELLNAATDAVAGPLDLLLPGTASLGQVLPGVAGALGADAVPGSEAARALLGLPSADRAVVVLVDGLGHLNLAERAGHAPFLRSLLAQSAPLTSTFPSTTATAMGTFGTGADPGVTGMLGYTVRDPATGQLGNLVSWTNLPAASTWQTEPSIFERLVAADVRVTTVGPRRFAGSGLTEAALRGAEYLAAESLDARVDATLSALRKPGLVYLYWGDVDKAGHHHGWTSPHWGDALGDLDAAVSALARRMPRGTLLLVTADHGMVDVDLDRRWDVGQDAVLSREVELVAGEPRALHLHLEPGANPDVVAHRWATHLGEHAVVATRADVESAGWLGAVTDRVRPVIGDVVVAMAGRATVVDSRTQTPASLDLVGVHGSLTRSEMLVPCLVTA
jgi:hypothetical protein